MDNEKQKILYLCWINKHSTMKNKRILLTVALLALGGILWAGTAFSQTVDRDWVAQNYNKQEFMIPMRDGIKIYTAVYSPKDAQKSPILVTRTPYGCAYGKDYEGKMWGAWRRYAKEGYIFVFQDVRGKGKSQGDYEQIRPFNPNKKGKQTDEASDFYDSADWLVKHVKNQNGRIGALGNSYSGFYTMMAVLSGHPALKAAVPQAPVISWFLGDDWHHNGAWFVRNAFGFMNGNGRVRASWDSPKPASKSYYNCYDYDFFLKNGTLKNLTHLFNGEVPFWDDMVAHPDEDEWWLQRDMRQYCNNIKMPVMVVGGEFDAEDNFGANQLYQTLAKKNPKQDIRFVYGPWKHGGWQGEDHGALGHIRFDKNSTTEKYQQDFEFPFLQHYLKDNSVALPEGKAQIFYTGENKWHKLAGWPERKSPKTFFLQADNTLESSGPKEENAFREYTSDPAHPVPFIQETTNGSPATYMTADQRFASQRPDVLLFQSAPLGEDLTVTGEIQVDLWVTLTTTDADFVVKVLDVFPSDFKYDKALGEGDGYMMGGYQMPLRMDVMRGRYREGFQKGIAFVPGKPERVPMRLQSIAHTFKKGHRIALQVQSTWFPLVDRNPQQFMPVADCENKDFVKTTVRVLCQNGNASKITFDCPE